MVIAQISDPHISTTDSANDRYLHTADHLAHAVEHLGRLQPAPDVVLLTGDLVERGHPDEYRRVRALLAPLVMPVYVIPGNHDDRDSLRAAFADHAYLPREGSFVQYVIEDLPVRLIALDTVVPGAPGGHLCAERLAWLDEQLGAAPMRPTLIFMHHPPFVTGIAAMDDMGLDGKESLAAVVRRHPQVERIVCGHLHRAITRRYAGTVAITCPSTAHQLALELFPSRRLSVVMEPPACLLHVWLDGEGLVTHTSLIGDRHPPMTVFDGERWAAPDTPPPPDFDD